MTELLLMSLHKVVLLVFLLSPGLMAVDAFAGQDDGNLARAIALREAYREEEALLLIAAILEKDPENYQALLNGAFLHFRQGWLYSAKGSEKQKQHFRQFMTFAERAFALRPAEYQARLLLLAARAKMSAFLAPGDQVRTARELHRELPALLAIAPHDPDLIYIYSWLNMKVGLVGAFERMLADMFFGGLPEDLTKDKAIALMQRAIELRPDYAVYLYDLGLFRQWSGQPEQARKQFERVRAMEPDTPEEVVYKKWAEERLTEIAQAEER